MKRIIAACCFLGISVCLGIIAFFSVNRLSDTVIEQAQVCLDIAQTGDTAALIEASEKFNRVWEDVHDSFTLVTARKNLSSLETNIPSLKMFAEQNAIDVYCEKCIECINTLEILKQSESINLGNIF